MSNDDFPLNFELAGVKFRGKYLSPEASLDAFALLAPCISSVLDSLDPEILKKGEALKKDKAAMMELGAQVLGRALAQFKDLPKIRPFFLPVYEAWHEANGDARFVPLSHFEKEVFQGKAMLMIAFLVAAVKSEYGDFLLANVSTTFADLAKVFGFRVTSKSTGPSGD